MMGYFLGAKHGNNKAKQTEGITKPIEGTDGNPIAEVVRSGWVAK